MQTLGPGFFTTLGATILTGADFPDPDLPAGNGQTSSRGNQSNRRDRAIRESRSAGAGSIKRDDKTWQVAGGSEHFSGSMLMGQPIPIVFVPLTVGRPGAPRDARSYRCFALANAHRHRGARAGDWQESSTNA